MKYAIWPMLRAAPEADDTGMDTNGTAATETELQKALRNRGLNAEADAIPAASAARRANPYVVERSVDGAAFVIHNQENGGYIHESDGRIRRFGTIDAAQADADRMNEGTGR